ncbi:BAG domain protein [Thermoascus aurantiacus ATCC 26904]
MTPSSAPLALSSLGETCAFYLDSIATYLPVSLRSLAHRFPTAWSSWSTNLEPSLRPLARVLDPEQSSSVPSPAALVLTVLACVLVVAAMWRRPFDNFWRRSPYSSTPRVNDSDYTYLTPEDIVDESEPDTLLLKHRGVTYPLHFPAYAIDDGELTVGQLRQRAAEKTGASDPRRIKLLYKRKLLEDDSLPCKAEGLKQQSEVVCVVSEVHPGESTPSEFSDSEGEGTSGSTRFDNDSQVSHGGRDGKKRNRKKRPKDRQTAPPLADPNNLAPPVDRRATPSPAPSLQKLRTPQEQVEALARYFRTELLPLCNDYVAQPPTDPHTREVEHRKLSETVMQQVILKADEINGDGDARNARRSLIKEAQAVLTELDQAAKGNE